MKDVTKEYVSELLRTGQALMTMGFVDTDVLIICLTGYYCGLVFRGDSATDAWNLWYKHLAEAHPGWGD